MKIASTRMGPWQPFHKRALLNGRGNDYARNACPAFALIVVLMLGPALLYASPQRSIDGMREAIVAGDAARASEFIDFDALRSSLKAQFTELLLKRMSERLLHNPLAAFGVLLGQKVVELLLDALVSPEGLRALMQGNLSAKSGDGSHKRPVLPEYRGELEGLWSYTATATTEGKDVVYRFRRNGPTWKLVDVRLPADAIAFLETRQTGQP